MAAPRISPFAATCETHSYGDWMELVSEYVRKEIGVHPDDLPDFNYRDSYDDGETAEDCAGQLLEDNGYTDEE